MFQTCDTRTALLRFTVIFPKYGSDILSPIFDYLRLR
jgi:hypothetical protein